MTAVLDARPTAPAPPAEAADDLPSPPVASDVHGTEDAATTAPSRLLAVAAGLSASAAAAMVGGMFAGHGARLVGGAAAVAGALWAAAAARSRQPAAWQVGLVPAVMAVAAASVLPGHPDALGQLDRLVAAARHSGRSVPPPVPFDLGWRPLLVVAFAVLGFASAWVATAARRPGLGLALPLPLLVLAATAVPTATESSSALVAGVLLFAALCAAHAARPDRAAAQVPLGVRLVRAGSVLVVLAAVATALGRIDALFPPPRVDKEPPVRPAGDRRPGDGAAARRPPDEAVSRGSRGRFRPSEDVPVELVVPVRRANPVLTYQRVRTALGTVLTGAAALGSAWAAWPGMARVLRRRRRAGWAGARGPRARVAAAYAEWRDLAIDLGVPGRGHSPLAFCAVVVDDEEHEQLAWLVSRTSYGDLAGTVGDEDARAAEDLSRSLRRRLIAAQPLDRRLAARFGRVSLRRPYSAEVPGALVWPRSGRTGARAAGAAR